MIRESQVPGAGVVFFFGHPPQYPPVLPSYDYSSRAPRVNCERGLEHNNTCMGGELTCMVGVSNCPALQSSTIATVGRQGKNPYLGNQYHIGYMVLVKHFFPARVDARRASTRYDRFSTRAKKIIKGLEISDLK
eukprot:sb/3474811/